MTDDKRATFNEVAETYDRVRNHYPEQLFADLFGMVQLPPNARVLEIGPGTGIATLPIAKRGYTVVGVELGTEMAKVARRKLAAFANVDIQVAAFEEWTPPAQPFDLVFAATCFHWLDPEVRYTKTAALLRPGGTLAIANYRHLPGGDDGFFEQVQACYERFLPRPATQKRPPQVQELHSQAEELAACGLFAEPLTRSYTTSETYTAGHYIDLLSTYSDHRLLAPGARAQLLDCIRTLIEGQYGGQVVKRYVHELVLARRR